MTDTDEQSPLRWPKDTAAPNERKGAKATEWPTSPRMTDYLSSPGGFFMSAKSWTSERAKVASWSRNRPADDPELVAARQNLKALKLEEYVRNVVDSAPPLRPDQADRIASLLRPVVGGAK